jgi:hypothetical protein
MPGWRFPDSADALVHHRLALGIRYVAKHLGFRLMVKGKRGVARHSEVGCRVVGKERVLGSLRVDVTIQAFCLTVEHLIAATFRIPQFGFPGEKGIEFGRERADLRRRLISGNRLRHLVERRLHARPIFGRGVHYERCCVRSGNLGSDSGGGIAVRSAAQVVNVRRPVNIERARSPDNLEQPPIRPFGHAADDASRVGIGHLRRVKG